MQLTGEVGAGKTTLVRTLLEQRLENVDIALCLNPQLTVEDLLATVCDELGVTRRGESIEPGSFEAVYRHSGGVPRLINVICDRALLGAYTQGAGRMTPRHVHQAAREALPHTVKKPTPRRWLALGLGLAGLAIIVSISLSLWLRYVDSLSTFAQSITERLTPAGRSETRPHGEP